MTTLRRKRRCLTPPHWGTSDGKDIAERCEKNMEGIYGDELLNNEWSSEKNPSHEKFDFDPRLESITENGKSSYKFDFASGPRSVAEHDNKSGKFSFAIGLQSVPENKRQTDRFNFATRLESMEEDSKHTDQVNVLDGRAENSENSIQRRESGIGLDWGDYKELPNDAFDATFSGSKSPSLPSSPYSSRHDSLLSSSSTEDGFNAKPLIVLPSDNAKEDDMEVARSRDLLTSDKSMDAKFEYARPRNVLRLPSNPDPKLKSARESLPRNRRKGFAFHMGDHAVPANAFVNTDTNPKAPKMLSVAEMMMKINVNAKLDVPAVTKSSAASHEANTPKTAGTEMLRQKIHGRPSGSRLDVKRFSLIGLRKVSSSEIIEDLKFLSNSRQDASLNLNTFEKLCLMWYDKKGRFCLGLVAGLVLALGLRLFLALYSTAFGS